MTPTITDINLVLNNMTPTNVSYNRGHVIVGVMLFNTKLISVIVGVMLFNTKLMSVIVGVMLFNTKLMPVIVGVML
jgi:hypothetical protein